MDRDKSNSGDNMSTSANVEYYTVTDEAGKVIVELRHNVMCDNIVEAQLKDINKDGEYTIQIRWPDENEVDQFTHEMPLSKYLSGVEVEWMTYEESCDEHYQ